MFNSLLEISLEVMNHIDNFLVNDLFEEPCFSCQSHLEIETLFATFLSVPSPILAPLVMGI